MYTADISNILEIFDVDDKGKSNSIKIKDDSDESRSFNVMRTMCERDSQS
jgi:hypothetical protein